MLKITYENQDQEIKFWIDPVSGSLCVQSETDIIEIPSNSARELLGTLKMKLAEYEESKNKNKLKSFFCL